MYDFEGDDFFSLKQRSQVLRYALGSSDGYGTANACCSANACITANARASFSRLNI